MTCCLTNLNQLVQKCVPGDWPRFLIQLMHNTNGLQQLFTLTEQLTTAKVKPGNRISTSTMDSIFFEMEAELNLLGRNEAIKADYKKTLATLTEKLV